MKHSGIDPGIIGDITVGTVLPPGACYEARAALLAAGILTDFLDGKVARLTRTVSEWGKVLDPLADKFAALAIVAALALRPTEPRLPLWLLALMGTLWVGRASFGLLFCFILARA